MASVKFIILLLLSAGSARAQSFAEWFSQGRTQRKYLLAQIEALHIYNSYLRQGYRVAKGGLVSITSDIGDEFKLHTAYYYRLKSVDPALKNNAQIKDILGWEKDIIKQTGSWQSDDMSYIAKVKAALLKDCEAQLTGLGLAVSGETVMTDAERLQQIERIHAGILSNLHFATSFSVQLKRLAIQKQQEINSNNTLKGLYADR